MTKKTPLVLRLLAVAGLLGTAIVHLRDLSGKLSETPYLGYLYIVGPIGLALVAAFLLFRRDERPGWVLAGGVCVATLVAFVLSRTTGLPRAHDDVGNWSETAGTIAIACEAVVIVTSVIALSMLRRRGVVVVGRAEPDRERQRVH